MSNIFTGNNKRITALIAALVVAAAAIAGITAGVRATTSSTVPVVPVANINFGEYLDWQNSITGMITTDAEQSIYLSDMEKVEEVLVSEGQPVHKGDVLLRYDISSTQMSLEKEKIKREQIELGITVARQNIKTLENTSAVSDGDGFGIIDDFMEVEAEEILKKATVYEKQLKEDAKPVNDDPEDPELGSEYYPYVFLCKGDSVIITKDFIKKWQKLAKQNKKAQLYIELETRDKALNLQKAWITDIMLLDPKYDVEVDLATGETSYAKINDPAQMAKLLRKILKEIPEDERGQWLAKMMDKLLVTSEKEDKKKERGELLAQMLNALNQEDREEFAEAAALLDEETLSTLFASLSENLTQEDVEKIDPDAVAGMLTLLLGSMTKEQIRAIDEEVLAAFIGNLDAEQLSSLDTEVIGQILIGMEEADLRAVMNTLLDARKDELVQILQDYIDEHDQGDGGDEGQGSGGDEGQGSGGNEGQQTGGNEGQGSGGGEGQQTGGNEGQQTGGGEGQQTGGGEGQQTGGNEGQETGGDEGQETGGNEGQETGGDEGSQSGQTSGGASGEGSGDGTDASEEGGTIPSTSPSPSEDGGSSSGSGSGSGSQLLTGDLAYTSDELAQARRDAKERLRDLELDLRESDIKIEKAQKALDEGVVTASMNGIVKTVGDPASPPTDGSAFLTVAAAEGLYVRSGIKESKLGTVKEGDIVTITSWQTGGRYEAQIKSISPYPDTTGMFDDSQTETYFPFTAGILDQNAELTNGEWVEVSYTSSGSGGSDGAMTIMKAFVREEGNRKYVYVRGEDKRLRKQYITTGSLSDSGYEILDGLSESDWVAFPYGKNVKEGARTREGSLDELY